MSFYNPQKWKYVNVKGLGFLKGVHCPHYDSQTLGKKRKNDFQKMIATQGGFGIAIDNSCAIEFHEKTYSVLRSKKNAHAYKVFKKEGKVVSLKIKDKGTLEELYSK